MAEERLYVLVIFSVENGVASAVKYSETLAF
jgi:hypothetical protein